MRVSRAANAMRVPTVEEHALTRRRLACIHVRNDANIADAREVGPA